MVSFVRTAAFAVLLITSALGSTFAQEKQDQQSQQRNQPGKFDFYVLALSWSPSFCKDTEERGRSATSSAAAAPTPSSFTACGRSMNAAFRAIARCRRRGSIAIS